MWRRVSSHPTPLACFRYAHATKVALHLPGDARIQRKSAACLSVLLCNTADELGDATQQGGDTSTWVHDPTQKRPCLLGELCHTADGLGDATRQGECVNLGARSNAKGARVS